MTTFLGDSGGDGGLNLTFSLMSISKLALAVEVVVIDDVGSWWLRSSCQDI
jgi:hypothetical protein